MSKIAGHGDAKEVEYHDKLTNMTNPSFEGENENKSDRSEVRVKIGDIRPDTDTSFSYVVAVTNPLPAGTKDISNRGQLTCQKAIICGETDDPTTNTPNDTTTRAVISRHASVSANKSPFKVCAMTALSDLVTRSTTLSISLITVMELHSPLSMMIYPIQQPH
jgi:hypothetical protein